MPNLLKHVGIKLDFLLVRNFKVVRQLESQIDYESDRIRLAMRFDGSRSYSIDVELSSFNDATGEFELLGELWEFEEMNKKLPRGVEFPVQASSDYALERSIEFIADYLRRYGAALLKGERELIAEFRVFREERNTQYNLDIALDAMRRRAQEAWEKKDLKELKQIYGPYTSHLRPSEISRLAYAHKKTGGRA